MFKSIQKYKCTMSSSENAAICVLVDDYIVGEIIKPSNKYLIFLGKNTYLCYLHVFVSVVCILMFQHCQSCVIQCHISGSIDR